MSSPNLESLPVRVIREPSVYVMSRQVVDPSEMDRFLADHGVTWQSDTEVAAEVITETAGRCCYMSFARPRPGGNAAYLAHIKEVGHGSVLEHAVWSLLVTNVSRAFTHEMVRHRAGFGYSQLSQRYVDESVAEYVEPDVIGNDPELHRIWLDAVEHAHKAYVALSERLLTKFADDPDKTARRKKAREAARSVLPNATETKLFMTGNARAFRHFLEMRGSRFADPEIRKVANRVLDVLAKESPNLFGDYRREPMPDGTFEIVTDYRKV
jgi:thymidylate synthase (FAD)